MAWVTEIHKLVQLKARYFFGLWVFGTLLIFLPEPIKQQMRVEIPEMAKPWLGFSTLAAFVLWIVQIILLLAGFIRDWIRGRKVRAEILSQLETLSQGERDIFLICLLSNQRTIRRQITDSDVHSLTAKRLISRAGGMGSALSWPHTIPRFVWEYIKANEAYLFPELNDENEIKELEKRLKFGWMRR